MNYVPAYDHDNGWEPSPGEGGAQPGTTPKTLYFLADGLGSTIGLLTYDGRISARYSYDEFGIVQSSKKFDINWPGPDNIYGYTGLEYEYYSDLNYARARYYKAEIGRFISEDSYLGDVLNPQTHNLYAYVHNNPINFIDPSGFAACTKNCDYTVYIVAGIQTSRGFFNDLEKAIIDQYDQVNKNVSVKVLFPYGDATEKATTQAKSVHHDYGLRENRAQKSEGGNVVRTQAKNYFAGGEMVFIGHSGGGVASYHGAKMLEALDGYEVKQVVQVGSPKVVISPSFQDKVTYVYHSKDPVTKLGSWWGPEGNKPFIFSKTLKPSTIVEVDIVRSKSEGFFEDVTMKALGGHMDYFRRPLRDENGVSNLNKTVDAIWEAIKP